MSHVGREATAQQAGESVVAWGRLGFPAVPAREFDFAKGGLCGAGDRHRALLHDITAVDKHRATRFEPFVLATIELNKRTGTLAMPSSL